MRLERGGSIRLRVGPPQIAPRLHQKTVVNLARFRIHFFHEESDQSMQKCLPNGTQKCVKILKKQRLPKAEPTFRDIKLYRRISKIIKKSDF